MKTSRADASVIRNAVAQWGRSGLLDPKTATALSQDLEVIGFDWKRLTKYSFWVSLICLITAIAAVFADSALVALLEAIFDAPDVVKLAGLTAIAAGIFWVGFRRRVRKPTLVFSNEAILFLGVLAVAAAVAQLGVMLDSGGGHFSLLLLFSFVVYGALGFFLRSNLVWVFALLSLGSWLGAETGYASGWGAYYLGMNFPLRFVLFGGALTALALGLEKTPKAAPFFRSTLAMGLLYLFVALWILSIFGNYGDMNAWKQVRQIELFHWCLLMALVAGGAIYHGLRFGNGMTKGFGLTFLFIGLYTRFFEYFWEATHKAAFFAILGVSFWLLGSKAERIWKLGRKA